MSADVPHSTLECVLMGRKLGSEGAREKSAANEPASVLDFCGSIAHQHVCVCTKQCSPFCGPLLLLLKQTS